MLAFAPVLDSVLALSAHQELELPLAEVPHPSEWGFELAVGEPHGQTQDYRRPLDDGRGLHLRVFSNRITIHWDRVHPTLERWWDHLTQDAPVWALFLIILAVAALLTFLAWMVSKIAGGSGSPQ